MTVATKPLSAIFMRSATSGSADQRAIQAVMDAHASEVDECAGQADDPSGEVALLLSISSDGRPMGVVIERAPKNLKEVGECVRQHALRWRFPASHGVVTARQSLSFGP